MRHPRLRLMARGILLTIIGWALLVFFALWHGATWPVGFSAWHAFVVVIVAIEFLTLKSWLMGRRACRLGGRPVG